MSQPPADFNPYQPNVSEHVSAVEPEHFSSTVGELSKWQYFFAILLIIGLVLMIAMFGFSMFLNADNDTVATVSGLACMGVLGLLIYGLPAIFLLRAAASARQLARENTQWQLAEFMLSQLKFWRTIGIVALIVIILYGIVLVFAVVGVAMEGVG